MLGFRLGFSLRVRACLLCSWSLLSERERGKKEREGERMREKAGKEKRLGFRLGFMLGCRLGLG